MTPDEIVKALRCCGLYDYDKNCGECPVCAKEKVYCSDVIPHAADLIESLQSQLADYHHMSELVGGKMEENQRLRRINENLQEQLADSQRREQAAVKQIEQKMIFDAGMGREPCEICANAEKTPCIHCEPKWRGPQEAGKEMQ